MLITKFSFVLYYNSYYLIYKHLLSITVLFITYKFICNSKLCQDIINNLSEEEFNEHIESLKTKITEKPKKLATEFSGYWSEICDRQYDFSRCQFLYLYYYWFSRFSQVEYLFFKNF